MKVTYVSTIDWGGPLSHLLVLAPAVAKLGVDVKVICAHASTARRFEALGIHARAVSARHKFDIAAAWQLWPLVAGADVVHTQDRRAGLLGRVLAKARGVRVVHTLHGLPETISTEVGGISGTRAPDQSIVASAWQRHVILGMERQLARLGLVVTPSNAMAGFLERAGFPRERLRVIHNAVSAWRVDRPHRAVPVIGVAARLEFLKGIDVLLAACARLKHAYQLEIFGDGSQRSALEAQARELHVLARFHGHVDDVRPHLTDLDLFVLPSRAENLPMAILEAMASRLPVVATNVGGIPDLVVDDPAAASADPSPTMSGRAPTGRLVPPDDVASLASAIDALLENRAAAEAMGTAGAARVHEHFAPDTMAQRTVDVYRELCRLPRA